jgi:peptidoglycan-associated lipoprotein
MNFRTVTRAALLVALAVSSTSCASWKKKKKGSGMGGSDSDFIQGTPIGGSGSESASGGGLGSPLPERSEGSAFMSSSVDRRRFAPIQFGFDSYTVSASEQGKIHSVASSMKNSSESLIIAGFTDERGTAEYNRGLGERRAQAVRQSLISSGLSGAKIQTVSFGAEMPVDSGSNEGAWAKNRRAEFGVTK